MRSDVSVNFCFSIKGKKLNTIAENLAARTAYRKDRVRKKRDGSSFWVYNDPGAPPRFDDFENGGHEVYFVWGKRIEHCCYVLRVYL